ncbi:MULTISPECIES: D-2-hydroxyacid dehydrogenase [Rhizobium]|uniref:Phosphoglycerate dehydrogenase-like enzyme n=1 Tax=Rhizobium binae TaxID=1138190 RepID=A0ABV2MPL8_9HYPH|nr:MULTISPECIES: D-2-hydroxyacid dehydrogenase [Rhizobium]NKL51461.1 D-2-hydroxyacid dehydrogenase [Rhizobium leguminosarum bv. viciae]MBX4938157.1 D-2-hydroxyacid dehydrogenase [Rhizobium binae]MBX4945173.1 D-2-hydroxyacid dehydrogenase [Rhizobium binae]MBX4980379.1 D-2-hydroxyacid dehydrogenase [Rhizobium binae]MBX4996002.1 D-2-hydroxyacid dehydrogenase [Rhizobium binae]
MKDLTSAVEHRQEHRFARSRDARSVAKILVYHPEPEDYVVGIRRALPDAEVVFGSDPDFLRQHIGDTEIILAPRFPVDALEDAQRLKWIQSTNSGVDFLVPVRERLQNTLVTNARGVHGEVMADYVLGTVTMLHWDFPDLLRQQAAQQWKPKFVDPLSGKTIGIVGLGAIGAEIARRAKSAGMTVLGMRRGSARLGEPVDQYYTREEFDEFLSRSDFVVLVVPATTETYKLVGAKELSAMKRSGYLINISRGSVVDELALIRAIGEGQIAGAALDVFEVEPLPPTNPLWTMPNVIVTSHIAGNPTEYPRRILEIFVENARRYLAGEDLINVVNLARGY